MIFRMSMFILWKSRKSSKRLTNVWAEPRARYEGTPSPCPKTNKLANFCKFNNCFCINYTGPQNKLYYTVDKTSVFLCIFHRWIQIHSQMEVPTRSRSDYLRKKQKTWFFMFFFGIKKKNGHKTNLTLNLNSTKILRNQTIAFDLLWCVEFEFQV